MKLEAVFIFVCVATNGVFSAPPQIVEIATTTQEPIQITTTQEPIQITTTLKPTTTPTPEEITTTLKPIQVKTTKFDSFPAITTIKEDVKTTTQPEVVTTQKPVEIVTTQEPKEIITTRRSILDSLLEEAGYTTSAPEREEEIVTFKEPEAIEITTTTAPETRKPARRRKFKLRPTNSLQNIKLIGLEDLIANDVPSQVKLAIEKKMFEPLYDTDNIVKVKESVNNEGDNEVDVNEKPRSLAHKFRNKVNFEKDGIARKEVVDKDGTVRGSYSYEDPSGKKIVVKYTAGKDGFKLDRNPEEKRRSEGKGLRRLKVQVKRPRARPARPSQKADTKAWINSLFARTASPPRSTTTTTTPPPPPPTTTTTTTTIPPPSPPPAPRRRVRVRQRQQQNFAPQQQQQQQQRFAPQQQQRFAPQQQQRFAPQQQQRFAPRQQQQQQREFQSFSEQPRQQSAFLRAQQRFKEQSRSQQRFQEQPRFQQRFEEQPRSQQQFQGQPRIKDPKLAPFSEFNSIFHNQRFQQKPQQQQFQNFQNFAPQNFVQQRLSQFSQNSFQGFEQDNFQTGFE